MPVLIFLAILHRVLATLTARPMARKDNLNYDPIAPQKELPVCIPM